MKKGVIFVSHEIKEVGPNSEKVIQLDENTIMVIRGAIPIEMPDGSQVMMLDAEVLKIPRNLCVAVKKPEGYENFPIAVLGMSVSKSFVLELFELVRSGKFFEAVIQGESPVVQKILSMTEMFDFNGFEIVSYDFRRVSEGIKERERVYQKGQLLKKKQHSQKKQARVPFHRRHK
jgi:hypothetical protein